MIRNREEAMRVALATKRNIPGYCQGQVRAWYLAPSVGDFDHDGAADAEDGWKSEPKKSKHVGDRNPPAGVPLSFLGGSHDNGHRAMSLPGGKVRSTDFSTRYQHYSPGEVGTANSIDVLEGAMGVKYVGWSETIDGQPIPPAPKPKPGLVTRGARVDRLIKDAKAIARDAKDGTVRDKLLKQAIKTLEKIPSRPKKK